MDDLSAQQESPPQNVKWDDLFTPKKVQILVEDDPENWKRAADRILIFTGLLFLMMVTFITTSCRNLLQDPDIITESIPTQISQQLSSTINNDTSGISNTYMRSSFVPLSIVFIVTVTAWFLSLVLSLMCALLATFLRQSVHKYLHTVQQNPAPHVRADIQEYVSRRARLFGISWLVEALPFLLLTSVHLLFTGLVAFTFRTSHTLPYFTLAAVGLCFSSYISLTLIPLIFRDCPYHTSSVLWCTAQIIPPSPFSVLYRVAKRSHDRRDTDDESMVKSFRDRCKNKAKSLSESMLSMLKNSAERILIVVFKKIFVWARHRVYEDHQLEELVARIPSLYASVAPTTRNNSDTQRTIRDVFAALPGPTDFHASLPWSIIQLAQRAFTSKLQKYDQQRRIRTCLRALYYFPGGIHAVLAPYSVGSHRYLEILPLLNTPESLEIIDELWDSPYDDIALSVRCAAAVVAAFMIAPPRRSLDDSVTPNVGFIADDVPGKQFLTNRLRVCTDADGGDVHNYGPHSDDARLHNIVRFLVDIKDMLQCMSIQWWTSEYADLIRRERRALFDTRHTEEHRIGQGTFDRQGDRWSPAFVPAAQQDLITLTLEILARDPVANAAASQREAFRVACMQLTQEASVQARAQASSQALAQALAQSQVVPGLVLEILARTQARAADSIEMIDRALEPVAQSLRPQIAID